MDALLTLANGADALAPWIALFFLALARVGGLLLALPYTSGRFVPRQVTMVVAVSLSFCVALGAPVGQIPSLAVGAEVHLIITMLTEFLAGAALGFVVHVITTTVRIAGEIVGMEMGLSFSAIADPISGTQSTAVSSLFAHLGAQLLLALQLDHSILRALIRSVEGMPLGAANLRPSVAGELAALGSYMVGTALNLAIPILGALFALKLSMAMLARAAPQLQIFALAFAIAITAGLIVLNAALPAIAQATTAHLHHGVQVLHTLAAAG